LREHAENTLEALNKVLKKNDIKSAQKRAQAWLNEHPLRPEQVVPIVEIDNATP
jgi:predicted oxidoreductase